MITPGEILVYSDSDSPEIDVVVVSVDGDDVDVQPTDPAIEAYLGIFTVLGSDSGAHLWRRCAWCQTLLPTPSMMELPHSVLHSIIGAPVPYRRRTETGELLCGDCTDRSMDIEQAASEPGAL